MFRCILVACDGSAHASAAVDKAVELQKLTGGDLVFLTVYRHYSHLEHALSMVRAEKPATMDDAMREYAEEIATRTKQRAASLGARTPRSFVKNGPVARSIVTFADEHACDLIVLGKRGLGSVEEYLLGSVSHKVTSLASCPVMVV